MHRSRISYKSLKETTSHERRKKICRAVRVGASTSTQLPRSACHDIQHVSNQSRQTLVPQHFTRIAQRTRANTLEPVQHSFTLEMCQSYTSQKTRFQRRSQVVFMCSVSTKPRQPSRSTHSGDNDEATVDRNGSRVWIQCTRFNLFYVKLNLSRKPALYPVLLHG